MKEIEYILKGIMCETCSDQRVFGSPPDDSPENKYVYNDLSGATRCFCKKHMAYTGEDKMAHLNYTDDWKYVCYGAVLISDLIKQLNLPQ
jgi:hypothetical protein